MANEIGAKLKSVRERFGFSQSELCTATGLGQSQLSRYERGAVSPSWDQIERILGGLDATVADLFVDDLPAGSAARCFEVEYWDSPPKSESDYGTEPQSELIHIESRSPILDLLEVVPVDGRYIFARAESDSMVPDWYPGDMLLIDKTIKATLRQIAVGFYADQPIARRLVGSKDRKLLVGSNRAFAPIEFEPEKWHHVGVVIGVVRNLRKNYYASKFSEITSKVSL